MNGSLENAAPARQAHVAVLLATYNGARYLEEQLSSIRSQIGVDRIDVLLSDDGSTDETMQIARTWQASWPCGRFVIVEGPRDGFSENFRHLARSYDGDADYVAFSDQDDIWDQDKLAAAIGALPISSRSRGQLYVSRTRLVDETGRPFGFSPLFRRRSDFRNALVQSIGGGNTMVFDRRAFALFSESAKRTSFISHDWWAYIIVSGAGGTVHYDPVAHIAYRQHDSNIVGKNVGLIARLGRLNLLMRGRFSSWTEQNLQGLSACKDLLTDEALDVMQAFATVRARGGFRAIKALRKAKLYRQTWQGNIALGVAAYLGKI